ncbi:hypothetical protein [Mycobacterium sp. P7213]|uniref:hypothetical protein n=1 Tax=Mycobacterium sp. P7213 TaxID=2478465 RepID=UPI000F62A40A|nr:hypothetical protein [Mycobacterium sp. P7213]
MNTAARDLCRIWTDMTARWYGRSYPPNRNELPDCLVDLYDSPAFGSWEDGTYDTQLLAFAIENTWSSAEYPEPRLANDADLCVAMFHDAREHLSIPDEPVTLYRGARDDHAVRRMSWTGTVDMARWFADRYSDLNGATGGQVYILRDVDPEHVLAQIAEGRDEDEYVLDPFYLDDAPIELFEDRRKRQADR